MKEKIINLANYLDENDVVSFGKNIKSFLNLDEEKIHRIINHLLSDIQPKIQKMITIIQFQEGGEEVILRNLYFGYCLRTSFEIIKLNKSIY